MRLAASGKGHTMAQNKRKGNMDAPSTNSKSPDHRAQPAASVRRWDIRYYYLVLSALVLAASTVLAFRQMPSPDAFASWRWDDAAWWRYPVERNAYKRLPVLRGITALMPLPADADHLVAAVGPALLYSEDGGASWSKAGIDWKPPAAAQ